MVDNITGKTYLERGKPVVVLARWYDKPVAPWSGIELVWHPRSDGKPLSRTGPRINSAQRWLESGETVSWPAPSGWQKPDHRDARIGWLIRQ